MTLKNRDAAGRKGIFLDERKIRQEALEYLAVIALQRDELVSVHNPRLTSNLIGKVSNRRQPHKTLIHLQERGLITNASSHGPDKDWHATTTGLGVALYWVQQERYGYPRRKKSDSLSKLITGE